VNERGQREGEMALDVLALHPATALGSRTNSRNIL